MSRGGVAPAAPVPAPAAEDATWPPSSPVIRSSCWTMSPESSKSMFRKSSSCCWSIAASSAETEAEESSSPSSRSRLRNSSSSLLVSWADLRSRLGLTFPPPGAEELVFVVSRKLSPMSSARRSSSSRLRRVESCCTAEDSKVLDDPLGAPSWANASWNGLNSVSRSAFTVPAVASSSPNTSPKASSVRAPGCRRRFCSCFSCRICQRRAFSSARASFRACSSSLSSRFGVDVSPSSSSTRSGRSAAPSLRTSTGSKSRSIRRP
mmetsp:Transcript_33265/g.96384  ORF Transcript_33265/g.96384 Transcript_33265/m.96384 type:complete len:264 (-) Transcript_33265:895-1686(-)